MKIEFEVPEDLSWLRELMQACHEAAETKVADEHADPKWASGYFACAKDVIHMIEAKFVELAETSRARYDVAAPAEPQEIRLENLGMRSDA